MKPHRRTAYLRALGVDIWVPKSAVVVSTARDALEQVDFNSPAGNEIGPFSTASHFFVGPGTSGTLLLCGSQAEASSVLARDIARSLKVQPLWGWTCSEGMAGGLTVEHAIRDRLITRLIVFGTGVGGKESAGLDADENAGVIGTAAVLQVASLPQLASSGTARRALWEALKLRQWCAARARVFSLSADGQIEG